VEEQPAADEDAGYVEKPSRLRKSPQQRKREAYSKERRNVYGQNDKASRKNIPRAKRRAARANRRATHQELAEALGSPEPDRIARAQERTKARRPVRFKKTPDVPLGRVLARRRWRVWQLEIDQPGDEWVPDLPRDYARQAGGRALVVFTPEVTQAQAAEAAAWALRQGAGAASLHRRGWVPRRHTP